MTNLDPNPPPTGPRPRPVAGRSQTMWLIAGAIIVLLVLGYLLSGEQTSVTPPAPEATAPADPGATAPAPAPAPAPEATTPPETTTSPADTTAPSDSGTTPPAPTTPPATSP